MWWRRISPDRLYHIDIVNGLARSVIVLVCVSHDISFLRLRLFSSPRARSFYSSPAINWLIKYWLETYWRGTRRDGNSMTTTNREVIQLQSASRLAHQVANITRTQLAGSILPIRERHVHTQICDRLWTAVDVTYPLCREKNVDVGNNNNNDDDDVCVCITRLLLAVFVLVCY